MSDEVTFEVEQVTSPEDLETIYRLRYEVQYEGMGWFGEIADHERRVIVEEEDERSWHFVARDRGRIVAATRLTWGGYGFSDRHVELYSLGPWLEELPAKWMTIGERALVVESHRGTNAIQTLFMTPFAPLVENDVRLVFGACEPHLLSLYFALGQRPYADRNINYAGVYLVPMVSFLTGVESLRGEGPHGVDEAGRPRLPLCVERALASHGAVLNRAATSAEEYLRSVREALGELGRTPYAAFDGLSDEEVDRCLARSNILHCARGHRVLNAGGRARNLFVVLDGTLEVRSGERVLGVLTVGDVFGEIAFLLDRPRAADVWAATDGVRVLSLSDGAIRTMIEEDPPVAAKLLLNVSRMLCVRLIKAN